MKNIPILLAWLCLPLFGQLPLPYYPDGPSEISNATQLQGIKICTGTPTNTQVLTYSTSNSCWQAASGITGNVSGNVTGNVTVPGSATTDTATIGPGELTTSGTCSGTGWTGTYPNYIAPSTTAPLTCSGFTSGQFYQTVTGITNNAGGGTVTVGIGTAQTSVSASTTSSTLTFSPQANGTSLTYTPTAAFNGTMAISAKLITPISTFALTLQDSTGAASATTMQTLASLHDYFIGGGAYTTTGNYNTGFGYSALPANTTGSYNTGFGALALQQNTTGAGNTASGIYALSSNTTGSNNTATGYSALYANTTGNYNAGFGYSALPANTTGSYNTASGYSAMHANTTGGVNTASGYSALYANTTGNYNAGFGESALLYNTTGTYNTGVGTGAGYTSAANAQISGSYNSFLGYGSGQSSATQQSYMTIVGAGATAACSSCVTLGRSTDYTQVGAVAYASLPSLPPAGGFIYCTNCTTAATCTSGGSGHMAASNGSAWTCQ